MKMKMHEFCIIASGLDPKADDFETRFFDVGCDDATVSFQKGHIIVDFTREAQSLEDAIASAIEAVRKAGANVMRVEPDPLVSLSDMAARAGMSRAAMSHYFKGTRARDFPAPVAKVTSESPLWDWATVARWMFKNDKLGREAAIEAEIVRQANEAISAGQIDIASRLKKRSRNIRPSCRRRESRWADRRICFSIGSRRRIRPKNSTHDKAGPHGPAFHLVQLALLCLTTSPASRDRA